MLILNNTDAVKSAMWSVTLPVSDELMLLQMSTASGRSGLNGQVVHSDVISVKELELASV